MERVIGFLILELITQIFRFDMKAVTYNFLMQIMAFVWLGEEFAGSYKLIIAIFIA